MAASVHRRANGRSGLGSPATQLMRAVRPLETAKGIDMQLDQNTYQNLLSPHNLALISDWLSETGELVVCLDRPHSGGSYVQYTIERLSDLRSLLADETWPEIHLTVFRGIQYPVRGHVDDDLVAKALQTIPEGQAYTIARIGRYPAQFKYLDEGETHAELKMQLEALRGEEIAVGEEPIDKKDEAGYRSHEHRFSISVTKNQNFYKPYSNDPDRYLGVVAEWYSP